MARFSSHLLLFFALVALLLAIVSATSRGEREREYRSERPELEACQRFIRGQGMEDERRQCCNTLRDIPKRERCSVLGDLFGRRRYSFIDSPIMDLTRREAEDEQEQQRLASSVLRACDIRPYECRSSRYYEDGEFIWFA